jgi:NAD(P)-dependent dehydrogenase (short-subunit alcohol dehydrogenase family)
VSIIESEGRSAIAIMADVTKDTSLRAMIDHAIKSWGRIDVLHYNVGVSLGGGDKSPLEITEEAFDNVCTINLRGFVMACEHTLPIMRQQRSGSILSISSIAAMSSTYPTVAYKTSRNDRLHGTDR